MQVSHVEALEHVSPIFKDFGFCPTGEGIDVRNLYRSFCTAWNVMILHFSFLDDVIVLALVLDEATLWLQIIRQSIKW